MTRNQPAAGRRRGSRTAALKPAAAAGVGLPCPGWPLGSRGEASWGKGPGPGPLGSAVWPGSSAAARGRRVASRDSGGRRAAGGGRQAMGENSSRFSDSDSDLELRLRRSDPDGSAARAGQSPPARGSESGSPAEGPQEGAGGPWASGATTAGPAGVRCRRPQQRREGGRGPVAWSQALAGRCGGGAGPKRIYLSESSSMRRALCPPSPELG